MNVNSTTSAVQLGSIPQSQPVARTREPQQATQESSIVKLSTRAIQLSQAANRASEVNETASREATEPAAVQRTENEGAASRARRIDTYA